MSALRIKQAWIHLAGAIIHRSLISEMWNLFGATDELNNCWLTAEMRNSRVEANQKQDVLYHFLFFLFSAGNMLCSLAWFSVSLPSCSPCKSVFFFLSITMFLFPAGDRRRLLCRLQLLYALKHTDSCRNSLVYASEREQIK